ncbi:reverse transcriptase domain-containing protein, partial [Tanacetum coccineum]
LATARAIIDVFNKKITLRVGDDDVIFDIDQSIKRSPAKDDECYVVDDLDDAVNTEAQELVVNDTTDSFLLKGLDKLIEQSDLKSCECEAADDSDLIWCIESVNTPYPVVQKTADTNKLQDGECASTIENSKDHFPLPFIDQMLERLCGNEYYCFLDGFSGFFQIPIALEDQEKTTFTCPYGTFAYRRMLCGLCNTTATFQRCMTAIFPDMVEDFMEVFMDDFLVFSNSFDCCLANLDRMLARCKETNLVLN